ncbi:MAG: ATP-binding cassette domain-containing protein [Antricoccus sp.]
MITFDSVTKKYPDGTVAVDNLNLELPTGKITAFVGPSGCGKTTTLRLINRMIDITTGTISIDGVDIMQQDASDLRRKIGYVIQHAGLFPHRTIIDNIATVPRLDGATKEAARKIAAELMERVGLPATFAKRYPMQLSGGQQQRVGVARALAADPPVMLMDEPFSALDPIVREDLQQEFSRLQSELGKTIAFVTHDIDEAIKMGDLVAIFREGGNIAQLGTPQELLENPADEFVANFVGRDRGFRSLSFDSARDLPVAHAASAADLVIEDGVARGWSINGRTHKLGGTFTDNDSLRQATDVAISSPVGIAVKVDQDGRATGVITLAQIAEHLEKQRQAERNSAPTN